MNTTITTAIVVVAATLFTSQTQAQDMEPKEVCEGLAEFAQEFAVMRDTGLDMVGAMNYFIEREGVTDSYGLEWVYTLASIAYENEEQTPDTIGYVTFLACMKQAEGLGETY